MCWAEEGHSVVGQRWHCLIECVRVRTLEGDECRCLTSVREGQIDAGDVRGVGWSGDDQTMLIPKPHVEKNYINAEDLSSLCGTFQIGPEPGL